MLSGLVVRFSAVAGIHKSAGGQHFFLVSRRVHECYESLRQPAFADCQSEKGTIT